MDKIKIYISIINKRVLYILFFISAFISIDVYHGFKRYAEYAYPNVDISACDIIFLSVFGINSGDVLIIDLIRWLIPFILVLCFVSIYTSNILNNKLKFTLLIRFKSYKERIKVIYKSIAFLSFVYLAFFFISISGFSILLSRNINSTSEIFLSINPDMQLSSLGIKYILVQLILSFTSIMIILLIQNIISFLLRDEINGSVISIAILITMGVLGKFDIPNICMLAKTSLINGNISVSVGCMLIINILIFILLSFVFIKLNDHSRKEL